MIERYDAGNYKLIDGYWCKYSDVEKIEQENIKLKQALDKAVETLNWYANTDNWRFKSTELETKARDMLFKINKILEEK